MPLRPKKTCAKGGCYALTRERFCEAHKNTANRRKDQRRGSAAQRGYGRQWRKARKLWLSVNPLCVQCEKEGRTEAASVVDHITPHRGDYDLFWDEGNWQSLCKRHHDTKTGQGG